MKNLAQAIIKVMQEVKGMEKNSRVGKGQNAYDGTKYKDVAEVFNNALEKAGLCIIPIGIQEETKIERWLEVDQWSKSDPKDMKSKQSVFTKVTTKYLLLHTSGESQELAGYGHGVDPQDKGAGKATTYALKNCLLYTFLTPVGKIDDTDPTHSDDIPVPPTTKEKTDDLDLQIAIAAINGSKSLDDLKKNYEEYIQFARVYTFSEAKEKKKKELTPKS